MTLYEIDQAILALVDPETGALADYEQFEQLQMDREKKIEGIALWIKDLDAEAAAIKAEKQNLEARQKAAEDKADRLRSYLARVLAGEKFKTPRVAISYRRSEAVEMSDMAAAIGWLKNNGYERYIKYVDPTVSKTDIKKVLSSVKDIPGVALVERNNMQIK